MFDLEVIFLNVDGLITPALSNPVNWSCVTLSGLMSFVASAADENSSVSVSVGSLGSPPIVNPES